MNHTFNYKTIFCIFGGIMISDLVYIISKNYLINRRLSLTDEHQDELCYIINRNLLSLMGSLVLYDITKSK